MMIAGWILFGMGVWFLLLAIIFVLVSKKLNGKKGTSCTKGRFIGMCCNAYDFNNGGSGDTSPTGRNNTNTYYPIFVLDKNPYSNIVTLGENEDLFTSRLTATSLNWIAVDKPTENMRVTAKTRYSQKESPAVIHIVDDDTVTVEFDEKQRAITKGQAVVFYDGEYVVGGGTIR